jgi:Nucleoside-diphosphate-sugar epimerases
MKKILITGAGGFIGSFLVEEALKRDWNTWAGIRKSTGREYLRDNRIQFTDLTYNNKTELKEQLRHHTDQYGKWDYIIHNAGVTKCIDPQDFERVNYLFTKNLIEALIETENIPEKFILMSSLSAYPHPETSYGRSKQKAEEFLYSTNGFPFIIMRPTGVYGPREKDYYLMVKSVKAGFDFAAGLKPQKLTFIYVKDLVKACFLSLESVVEKKAYCVADGNVYTDAEYTRIVKESLGKKFVIRIKVPLFILKGVSGIAEAISRITRKPSTLNRDKYKIMKKRDWTCDTHPLENELGFKADYNLIQGMQETIEWYQTNKWI